jgi:hypothetical protein
MPWKECNHMDERLRIVAKLLDGDKMTAVCHARWQECLADHLEPPRCYYNFVKTHGRAKIRTVGQDTSRAGRVGHTAADFPGNILVDDNLLGTGAYHNGIIRLGHFNQN